MKKHDHLALGDRVVFVEFPNSGKWIVTEFGNDDCVNLIDENDKSVTIQDVYVIDLKKV